MKSLPEFFQGWTNQGPLSRYCLYDMSSHELFPKRNVFTDKICYDTAKRMEEKECMDLYTQWKMKPICR